MGSFFPPGHDIIAEAAVVLAKYGGISPGDPALTTLMTGRGSPHVAH